VPAPEETGRSWSSPRHWSLRVKLAIVLLVPGVLALALGGLRIADQTGEAAELGRVARYADAQGLVAGLTEAVAQERFDSAVYVARDREDPAAVEAATAAVDAAVGSITPALDELVGSAPELNAPVRQAEQAVSRLADVRGLVTTSAAPPSAVLTRYSEILARLVELDETLLRGVNTTEVNGLATALSGLAVARSETSLQYALVSAGLGAEPAVAADVQSSEARLRTGLADFRAALDAGQRVRYTGLIAGGPNTERTRVVQGLLAGQPAPRDVASVYVPVLDELDAAEDGVRAELTATSEARRASATTLAVVNTVLLALALLLGALVVGLVARAMIVSLRTLRSDALDIAQRRLPEAVEQMKAVDGEVAPLVVQPIAIDTREEIGEVARAFDAVHAEAVRLAAQQALLRNNVNDIFVNLSRRSQGLVGRQLKLIDELEQSEQDPEHLGNLFQLDHLATRMRRNNENLLVLAGAAELRPRRKRPVPAQDVLRASVSEVEQYRRVTVRRAPDVSVAGPVVNDLVHLVAELLDNATTFSPPDSPVVLEASWGTAGRLVVEIRDSGVGIEADELQTINEQLASPPVVDVAVSRRMGLFVVGRLASRHGIAVALRPASSGSGLLASVEVPAVYLQTRSGPDGPGTLPPTAIPAAVGQGTSPGLPRRTPGGSTADSWSWATSGPSAGSSARDSSREPSPVPSRNQDTRTAAMPVARSADADEAVPAPRTPVAGPQTGAVPPVARPAGAGHPAPPSGPQPVVRVPEQSTGSRAPRPPDPRPADAPPVPPLPRRTEPVADLPRRVPGGRADGPVPPGDPLSSPWDLVDRGELDEPDLPIYGEMRSAWFRQRRFAPALQDWPAGDRDPRGPRPPTGPDAGPTAAPARPGPAPRRPEAPPSPADRRAGRHVHIGGVPGPQPGPGQRPGPGRPTGPGQPGSGQPGPGQPGPERPGPERPGPPQPGGSQPDAPAPGARPADPSRPAAEPSVPPAREPVDAAAGEPAVGDATNGNGSGNGANGQSAVSDWGSADAGWQAARTAANTAADRSPEDAVTSAGLPKRRPKAQLVPGSVGDSAAVRPPTRSPEMVRGRLSGYQQGLRQGREARAARAADPAGGEAD
jgi:signal transduction histidine kinase